MTIKQFIQGKPQTEDELFTSLGSMVLSKDVHDKLGTSVNSRVGDIWWIVYDFQGSRMGFAQARSQHAGLNIRYIYSVGSDAGNELVEAIFQYAREQRYGRIFSRGSVAASSRWKVKGFEFIKGQHDKEGIWEMML